MLRSALYFIAIPLFFASVSCQSTCEDDKTVKHVVLCWLKDKSPESKSKFIDSVNSLSSIPSVVSIDIGGVVSSLESVADNSFDICFIIDFNNKAGLDAYLVHPKHISAVENVLKPSLKKVIVYDFKTN